MKRTAKKDLDALPTKFSDTIAVLLKPASDLTDLRVPSTNTSK